MNRKQRKKRIANIQESQAKKTFYNKAHQEEIELRTEQFELEKQLRLTRERKRRVKKVRKKRIQWLKSLRRKDLITVEEYQEGMKKITKRDIK